MLRKSFVPLILIVIALSNSVNADVNLGIKGGLNLSKYWGNENDESVESEYSILPGFTGGLYAEFIIFDNFSIQPEVLYAMKGTKATIDSEISKSEGENKLHYLEIPVLLKLRIPVGSLVPNFYVGPAFDFKLGVSVYTEMDGEEYEYSDEQIENFDKSKKVFDFCLPIGGGLDIDVGSINITIDARYTLGLTPITQSEGNFENVDEEELPAEKNSSLSFMAGLSIPLGN